MIDRVNENAAARAGGNPRNSHNFLHDRRGYVAVEFALIALPFLLMIVAILEYAYGNFAQARLDAVVAKAGRQIMTGYVNSQTIGGAPLTAAQFRDKIICKDLPALLKCSDIYVDVAAFKADPNAYKPYINASNSGLVTPKLDTTNGYCIGSKEKPYVVLRVAYPAPIVTTSVIYPNTITYKGRKARLLTSVATFKNEPFQASNMGAGC